MAKPKFKINRQITLFILTIIVSGLLNICLFTPQAKAASFTPAPKFFYSNDTCALEETPPTNQTINRPAAPMPECCLARNRYYDAVFNTANNQSAPFFTSLIILPPSNPRLKDNFTYNTLQNIYPPPAKLALASTVIRE